MTTSTAGGRAVWATKPTDPHTTTDLAHDTRALMLLHQAADRVLGPDATREDRTRLALAYAAGDAI